MFGIGRGHRGFSGELALGEAVEAVGLARQGDVAGDVRPLAVELVGFDDEGAHVPSGHAGHDPASCRGNDGRQQPTRARLEQAAGEGNRRPEQERHADEQHACQRDVCVGVGDAGEDGVRFEEEIEAADVLANGQREEQKTRGNGYAAPDG